MGEVELEPGHRLLAHMLILHARDIANSARMDKSYPNKFAPTLSCPAHQPNQ